MLATFTTAAKEELLSSFVPWSADECICAFESQGKKVHQGVAPQNLALHQGIAWSNSTTALGLRGAQLETRVRSRCTGKERDTESGLDNFGARYNASGLGRFMTPDSPSYSNHKNPQSWNLYAYALNNPVAFRDADGHLIVCANNASQCQQDAAAATGNALAASQVTTQTTTTQHSFLGLFHWTTTQTQIAITGDINSLGTTQKQFYSCGLIV